MSFGITGFVLMFTKAPNNHFSPKRRYKMVASRQVEISFFTGFGQQHGCGFGAPAQVIGRTKIPLLLQFVVPAAKRVSFDLLEIAVSAFADIVSGGNFFKTAARSVGWQTLRKQLGSGSRKKSSSRFIRTKSAKQTSRSRRDIFSNVSH